MQLAKTKAPKVDEVLYATTELYADPDLANQRLSLTYFPQYNKVIDVGNVNGLEMIDNLCNILRPEDVWSASRVWPAFGKSGGSHEVLIVKPDVINGSLNLLPDGGAPEAWFQDDVQNYDLQIAQAIAIGMVDALETSEGFSRPETYAAKTVANGVAITTRTLKDMNVTLSAAWKKTPHPKFKFWACLWTDHNKPPIRFLLDPFVESLSLSPFLLCGLTAEETEKCIRDDIRKHGCICSLFTETIKSVLQKVMLVSDGFFSSHCQKIDIPT
jgi:hypothetical protein